MRYAREELTDRGEGLPAGFEGEEVLHRMRADFGKFINEVTNILTANRKLLAAVGKLAAEKGVVTGSEFVNLVEAINREDNKENHYILNKERMMVAREEVSLDYYKNIVLKETGV